MKRNQEIFDVTKVARINEEIELEPGDKIVVLKEGKGKFRLEVYTANPANNQTYYKDSLEDILLVADQFYADMHIYKNNTLYAAKDADDEEFYFYR